VTMKANSRQVNGVTVVDLSGNLTCDEGSQILHDTVQQLSLQGSRNILLNLSEVARVDTAGIGELVSALTSVRSSGGDLKLFNATREVHDLLQITKLTAVFDVQEDEASAVAAFQERSAAI
jgi:anti-sigma B factor antagonist